MPSPALAAENLLSAHAQFIQRLLTDFAGRTRHIETRQRMGNMWPARRLHPLQASVRFPRMTGSLTVVVGWGLLNLCDE